MASAALFLEYCPRCEPRVSTVVRELDLFDEYASEED